MHLSDIILTYMNDILAQKAESLFPIVMASTIATNLQQISYWIIGIGIFPELCWLSLYFSPVMFFLSPVFVVVIYLFGIFIGLFGGGAGFSAAVTLIIAAYLFMVFMAIFGEIILIPWFILSIFPVGFGVALYFISNLF